MASKTIAFFLGHYKGIATSNKCIATSSFLLLVVMPLLLVAMHLLLNLVWSFGAFQEHGHSIQRIQTRLQSRDGDSALHPALKQVAGSKKSRRRPATYLAD